VVAKDSIEISESPYSRAFVFFTIEAPEWQRHNGISEAENDLMRLRACVTPC
jgi:hypothetical protein